MIIIKQSLKYQRQYLQIISQKAIFLINKYKSIRKTNTPLEKWAKNMNTQLKNTNSS